MITWGLLLLDVLLVVAVLRGRWQQALALEHAQPAPGHPSTPKGGQAPSEAALRPRVGRYGGKAANGFASSVRGRRW
jgi:hypothetical protein